MASKINNGYGVVTVENEVVARIAGQSVTECAGVVGMAAKNVKDGIVQLLKKENLTKGVQLSPDGDKLAIGLHIIVNYGTNITAITENILQNVRYNVEEYAGVAVSRINIFIEGIRSDE